MITVFGILSIFSLLCWWCVFTLTFIFNEKISLNYILLSLYFIEFFRLYWTKRNVSRLRSIHQRQTQPRRPLDSKMSRSFSSPEQVQRRMSSSFPYFLDRHLLWSERLLAGKPCHAMLLQSTGASSDWTFDNWKNYATVYVRPDSITCQNT